MRWVISFLFLMLPAAALAQSYSPWDVIDARTGDFDGDGLRERVQLVETTDAYFETSIDLYVYREDAATNGFAQILHVANLIPGFGAEAPNAEFGGGAAEYGFTIYSKSNNPYANIYTRFLRFDYVEGRYQLVEYFIDVQEKESEFPSNCLINLIKGTVETNVDDQFSITEYSQGPMPLETIDWQAIYDICP